MATVIVSEGAPRRSWRWGLPERLPALKGRWLTAYSLLWMMIGAISLAGTIGGTVYRLQLGARQTHTFARLGIDCDDAGTMVRSVAGSALSKVHRGDAVLFINGVRIPKDPDAEKAQSIVANNRLLVPEGTQVQLTLQAPHGHPRQVTLTSSRANAEVLYASTGLTPNLVTWLCTLGLMSAPLILIAAAFLHYGRRRDPVAALLSLCFIAWPCNFAAANLAWMRWIGGDNYRLISPALGGVGVLGLTLAFLTFPRGRFEPRWTAALALLLPLFLPAPYVPESTVLNYGFVPILVAAIFSMGIRYHRTPVAERQQWRWALLGFAIGVVIILFMAFGYSPYVERHAGLSVDLWSWVLTPALASLTAFFLVGGVTLSVLRYRLYDTGAAVSRSAAYGVLTLSFIALFAGVERLAEIVGEKYFEHSIGLAAGAVGAAVAAACIVPLHSRVHRWAERRFQKPLIRLREGLPDYLADLRDTAPLSGIVNAVMKRVETGARSTREAVLISDRGRWTVAGVHGVTAKEVRAWQKDWTPARGEAELDCKRKDALFPLRMRLCIEGEDEAETIGWLLLGPRPDGSFFGKDEREALSHVAGPIARAIRVAQMRQHERLEISSLRSNLSRVEEALARLLKERSLDAEIAS